MRILQVAIREWRNLRDVQVDVPPDAPLVCLVGENGTGKSAILEMLSSAAVHLGIAHGVDIPRGDPVNDPHDFSVVARVPQSDELLPADLQERLSAAGGTWDGVLQFRSRRDEAGQELTVTPMMEDEALAQEVGNRVVAELRNRRETQHLYLDADRAYPPFQLQAHQFEQIFGQDWRSDEWTRQWSYRPTRTLYEEWIKYFIAVEERAGIEHIAGIRRSRATGEPEPVFEDPFDDYRESILEVLPHLRFVGVESTGASRTPLFDTAGMALAFSKLSGGEREIAFLIGQIERFRLRRGLLLIDEPELHLNPDLLRSWLAFLRDTVQDGQVWIATHSLEAVEVAGPHASFVLEREADTRLVKGATILAGRPVITALSTAVGAPAFSLSRLRFVYIEGDRQTRERERFFEVCGEPDTNRFIEGGSSNEVIRRFEAVRSLAAETGEQLKIGAVIDRDFRSDDEVSNLEAQTGVHVLGCHEIENVFLAPDAIAALLERAGLSDVTAEGMIREAGDYFAGLWIAQRSAAADTALRPTRRAMAVLSDCRLAGVETNWDELVKRSEDEMGDRDAEELAAWRTALKQARAEFATLRANGEFWLHCLGKQALPRVASALGLSGAESLERHVVQLWNEGSVPPPAVALAVRSYVGSLA